MTASLKPYPAYKDSGVEWLGRIPEHWETKRLKFLARVNPGKSEIANLPDDTEVSFLPMEQIGAHGSLTLEETRPLASVWTGFTYFRDGDVVVAKITPCFENGKGALCRSLVNGIGFGTTELHVIRPLQALDAVFMWYVVASDAFRAIGVTEMSGAAGQQRVPDGFVSNYPASVPSLPEQRAIAAFLDRETQRSDALVEKKERLVELLREKRTALISHAVTRGLDHNCPVKILRGVGK